MPKAPPNKPLSRALINVLGPVSAEIGQLMTDYVRLFRWKSAVNILNMAASFAKKKGIRPKQVPVRFLVPFLEKSSLIGQDAEETKSWAALLVSALEREDSAHTMYIDILSQISKREIDYLQSMVQKADRRVFESTASAFQSYAVGTVFLGEPRKLTPDDAYPMEWIIDNGDRYGIRIIHYWGSNNPVEWDPNTGFPSFVRSSDARSSFEHLKPAMVLDRLGLIRLRAAHFKDQHFKQAGAIWAELTALGFSFGSACSIAEDKPREAKRSRRRKAPG